MKRKILLKGDCLVFMGYLNRWQLKAYRQIWEFEHKSKTLEVNINKMKAKTLPQGLNLRQQPTTEGKVVTILKSLGYLT